MVEEEYASLAAAPPSETETDDASSNQKPNSSRKQILWSTIIPVAALVLVVLVAGCSWNSTNNSSSTEQQQQRRRAIAYSKLATIPPDPVSIPASEEVKTDLAAKYGRWHFWDGEEDARPDNDDLCDKYPPVCDIPGDDFPNDSWQGDAVYVNHILNDADELVTRAMEAIFEEYGHPKPKSAEGLAERMKMFHWDKVDLKTAEDPPEEFRRKAARATGGWTTKRSFEGLVRRILHAIMTSGTFTVVVAGHSSAAGHGNHFRQSYAMQFHRIMAPIFARLGVTLITRNISQGGMGTLQNALGAADIYGRKLDILIWDSGMTEKGNQDHIDFFFRQGLIGGDHAPLLWSAGGTFDILKRLHEEADADVGEFGLGLAGIELTKSDDHAETLPWAVRYFKCDSTAGDTCKRHNAYCTKCWIDRKDGIKPEKKQLEAIGGQVSWHPGWRQHQLTGRVLAFSVLEGLQLAIQQFSDGTMGGPPLADDYWHLGDYFKNIQDKVKNMDPESGPCAKGMKNDFPDRLCKTPMKGRTQFTPRANYDKSSITSIIKPTADGYIPKNTKEALYEGPDEHNDCYDIPPGEVDVLSIVSGRRRRMEEVMTFNATAAVASTNNQKTAAINDADPQKSSSLRIQQQESRRLDGIKPGKGWELVGEPQGFCDGEYNSVCSRWTQNDCVLSGHHDSRAHIVGNALSGWLVMNVNVKEGIIMLKMHTWALNSDNTITQDWSTENNERRSLHELNQTDLVSPSHERMLKGGNDLPDNTVFEYAINGKVTTLTKEEFDKRKKNPQRVVEIITLLDDPDFTKEEVDVEVAIRLQGCGKDCTIGLTHVYWA